LIDAFILARRMEHGRYMDSEGHLIQMLLWLWRVKNVFML